MALFHAIYNILWGDLITIPLPGGSTLGLSLLVLILVPAGIYFTIRTKFLPFRLFPEMLKVTLENNRKIEEEEREGISGVQALIVSTACRVGMGNLVGVVAAISAGGAGAVFWMWVIALVGSSTAFIEATLAQLYKEKDPLYGGYRGGPAYYIHALFIKKGSKKKKSILAVLFAVSGLICWCGISQVISNSISSSFENAFHVPPIYSTVVLVVIAAIIVLRKNATVKVLDIIVPIMAACYFFITIFIIVTNAGQLPAVFGRIFSEAFGIRQVAGGGIGAVIMNGAKRGLFSNEAGSGSAPCAAAAADISHPAKEGLLQALGVFIDTLVICTCSAMIMLLTPEAMTKGLEGMDLLQTAMQYHLGEFGVVFIAVILWLFSFSTFLGILFYARSNVAYLFGDNWISQTLYKVLALVMLFIGGLAAYQFVWDLGDLGVGLMTVFNMIALIPLAPKALTSLKDYEKNVMTKKKSH
ncbi:alanine:cation symporter family protein [Mediterraneibacter catenae]|jgi:AGCS family alanine or glycine:cation symporter|uniref:Alanine:cation symporter family protein n=1 Tax=Mediterraneibacter catenae TaxID=2594882 RepID=A0A5M9HV63_9FIRM|nr:MULTISPECIES: alanine/glycine:cation symporter family protein [Mediterraneibacter]HJA19824.1 alanine:cation symporter family protein [Candidatus Mediterraneibacter ornithocaccae]KAA8500890.1 alanine:cation symporter family protein [Mediterraneibacter catenae]MCF2568171.1 alanine:cation symporter family protein [Mediterraneibacter glycyrrhizinilyticus]MDN0043727.1 alanine/glycine:cation symporter family protein [Mediterraneibacter glycyrrhizinilyticus]MDN0061161.1 alanine/glycine:cation symp